MNELRHYKVYMLEAPDGRVYIGMTSQNISNRCRKSGYTGCPLMGKAVEEFGWDSFKTSVLGENLTKEEAEKLEKDMILKHDSTNPLNGFNVALGGNIPGRHTENTLQKMSESQKGRIFTSAHKERLRKPKKDGAMKRSIKQYTLDGKFVRVYSSLAEAAEAVNAFAESIVRCCNHKQHTAKGFVWEYGGYGND